MVKFANTRPFKVSVSDKPLSETGKANTKPFLVWIAGDDTGGGGSGGGVSKEFVLQKVGEEAEARRQADDELQKQINDNKDSITTVSESVKTKIDDAPKDGQFYGRQNGLWAAGNINIEEI